MQTNLTDLHRSAAWRVATALVMATLLAGCSTTKEDVIPQDGPDMLTIYRTHAMEGGHGRIEAAREGTAGRPIGGGDADLNAWTRQSANEIEQVFPLLPNPMLVLYVFPHLSAEGAPVPGYTTAFRMYEVDRFAMPGEVDHP